ncbi:MAG: type IX secretion system protein PorQ [Bacteroidetes bacterium]|nr:type IX secretion system protein PorQ [Bacteroidota bacterium]
MKRFTFMQLRKWSGLLLFILLHNIAVAQVVGGQRAMEFLRMSNAPHISALGGINIAHTENDIAFAIQNPALMRPGLHNQLGLNYNAYYSGITIANLQYGYHNPTINTSFIFGVQYLNYGSFTQTDASGNEYGTFHANDYVISLGASRSYNKNWRYGSSIKYAGSRLYDKTASAVLADVGVNYFDTASLWDFGITAKNIGFMVKKYSQENPAEPLPLDVQLGISKRFKHLPLRLLMTVHHLYQWDVRYNNPADIETSTVFGSTDSSALKKSYFADKLFRHFIFGAEISIAKRLTLTVAYNHLRRGEMVIKDKTALAGFSFGLSAYLNKFQVHYARSYYSLAGAYNEIGISMQLNKMFGLGKASTKMHWKDSYPDWQ